MNSLQIRIFQAIPSCVTAFFDKRMSLVYILQIILLLKENVQSFSVKSFTPVKLNHPKCDFGSPASWHTFLISFDLIPSVH